MKLSEAIRAGSKIRRQAYGAFQKQTVNRKWWHRYFGQPEVETRSCAMGAAVEAEGCGFKEMESQGLPFRGEPSPKGCIVRVLDAPAQWPLCYYYDCPQCDLISPDGERLMLAQLIPHLNDDHKWTREQIAFLVERFENSISASQAQEEEQIAQPKEDPWPEIVG